MGKYNSINDAVRAKIDKLIEKKGLDKKDYLYTADVASSLNQLASIMGGSGDSMTIADSLYDVLDSVDGGIDGYKLIDGSFDGDNGEIIIPAGKISSIGYYGLAGTRATKIDLKNSGINIIKEGGFSGNYSLNEIAFPDDLRQIGASCFTGCSNITDINWNSNVVVNLQSTFAGCTKLVNVPILTAAENTLSATSATNTFAGCSQLKKVILIGAKYLYATFGGCSSLEYVYLGSDANEIQAGAFGGVPITCKVRCGFSEGANPGFPANGGWAGNPNDLDIEYDVPVPTEYPED